MKFCDNWPTGLRRDVWHCNTMRVLGRMSNNDLIRPKSSKHAMKSYVLVFSHI